MFMRVLSKFGSRVAENQPTNYRARYLGGAFEINIPLGLVVEVVDKTQKQKIFSEGCMKTNFLRHPCITHTRKENSLRLLLDYQKKKSRLVKAYPLSIPRARIRKAAPQARRAVFDQRLKWWSRGELNPCPKTHRHNFLRVQSVY